MSEPKKDSIEPKKDSIVGFIAKTESVRLTNGLIALTARLFTSTVLAILTATQRKRPRW